MAGRGGRRGGAGREPNDLLGKFLSRNEFTSPFAPPLPCVQCACPWACGWWLFRFCSFFNTKAFLDGAHVRLKSAPIALYLGSFSQEISANDERRLHRCSLHRPCGCRTRAHRDGLHGSRQERIIVDPGREVVSTRYG